MQLPLRGVNGRALLRFLPLLRARGRKAKRQAQEGGPIVTSKLIVPLGLAISCLAHLVFLGPALIFAGGSPFNTPPAEAIAVDIVSSEDLPQTADAQAETETSPAEEAAAPASPPSAASSPPAAATAPPPAPQPSPADPRTARQARATQQAPAMPQSVLPPPPFAQQPQPEPPLPAATPGDPAEMFGMPMTMPDGSVGGRTFDSQAVDRANIENDAVAAFRAHLKTCSKLPAGVAPDVRVVLRVYLRPDGTLATGLPSNPEPIKVEGVSIGGGALFQSAVAALRKCQPYRMLPPDRYQEWKMLDIPFTPQNF